MYDSDKMRPSLLTNENDHSPGRDKQTPKTQKSRHSIPGASDGRAVKLKDNVPRSRFDPLGVQEREHSLDL